MKQPMKYIIIVMFVLGVGGGIYYLENKNTITVEKVKTEIVEKVVEKEINPLDAQIEQREAELTEKYEKIKKLEARIDVLKTEREKMDVEIKSLQKELATFIQGEL